MRNMIDTNVWIDGISGNLPNNTFLVISVEAEWAGYSDSKRLFEDSESELEVDSKYSHATVYALFLNLLPPCYWA